MKCLSRANQRNADLPGLTRQMRKWSGQACMAHSSLYCRTKPFRRSGLKMLKILLLTVLCLAISSFVLGTAQNDLLSKRAKKDTLKCERTFSGQFLLLPILLDLI